MCCTRKLTGYLLLLAIIVEAGLMYWLKTQAPVGFLGWEETSDVSQYYGPSAPDPPYDIGFDAKQTLLDEVASSHALSNAQTDFDRIVALRNWTRETCPRITKSPDTNSPLEILQAYRRGEGGACGSLASLYCATLIAHSYRARILELIRDPADIPRWREGPLDTHVTVEVFSPAHQKWIEMDPTFNCWYHRPGGNEPLSARELQLIVANPGVDFSRTGLISLARAGAIVAETGGFNTTPTVETYYIDPILIHQNAFLLYYNVFLPDLKAPAQKLVRILSARFLGTEKVVWMLLPGQKQSYMAVFERTANWTPAAILVLLVLMLIPSGPSHTSDYESEGDDDEEDEKG